MEWFNLNKFEASQSECGGLVFGRERDIELLTPKNTQDKVYRIIRGKRCIDKNSLFQEWAAALQFPYYFGHNWDAFDECISDLSWLKARRYTFLVTNIESVLPENHKDFKVFLEILKDAAKVWSEPVPEDSDWRWTKKPIPFHIVFHCETQNKELCRKRLEAAQISLNIKNLTTFDKVK